MMNGNMQQGAAYNSNELEKIVHGGLVIKRMEPIKIDEEHYGLYKSRFDLDKLKDRLNPQAFEKAQEIKHYLDAAEPTNIIAYANKFRSYNQLLMIQDVLQQLWNNDGPYLIRKKPRTLQDGFADLYEMTLSTDFCERITIPQMGTIKLRVPERKDYDEIRCRVLKFDSETNILQFSPINRNEIPENMFTVSFEPSRFVYKARNYILINAQALQDKIGFLIFPEPLNSRMTKEDYIEERNRMIACIPFATDHENFNQEQQETIAAILMGLQTRICNRSGTLLPYIVHGPPGTGKTVTLVEAVRLLLKLHDKNRIVVCTPSNTAADLFARELLETLRRTNMDSKCVFRMYALALPPSQMDDSLRDNSFILPNSEGIEMFGIPPRNVLVKFRVIVCTVMASIYLTLGGLSQTFSHIIMDECGQVSELETLVPIVGLTGRDTKIVMAGDHQQLGPIDTLGYFQKNNITKSLIERFHDIEYYKDDPRVRTFLHQNYRSHQSIITVPSQLFYNNEMITAKDAKPRDKLSNWSALPNKGFPIMWHHIETKEEREQNGTSYMNPGEMDSVVSYIKDIIRELNVKADDIGVVSPYEYQARRLRQRCLKNYPNITIDTVERFQGSQRRVIIVTTVRCNPDDVLGFMRCPKRFNTTITRAEELLVVVGNAKTMAHNGSWRCLLQHCYENKATIDVPPLVIDDLIGKRRATADESETSSEEATDEEETSSEEAADEGTSSSGDEGQSSSSDVTDSSEGEAEENYAEGDDVADEGVEEESNSSDDYNSTES